MKHTKEPRVANLELSEAELELALAMASHYSEMVRRFADPRRMIGLETEVRSLIAKLGRAHVIAHTGKTPL